MLETKTTDQTRTVNKALKGALPPEELLRQFQRDSVQETDALQGLLAHQVGQIWELTNLINGAIKQLLSAHADQMSALRECSPAVEMLIRAHRQADRYLQITEKHATARREPK